MRGNLEHLDRVRPELPGRALVHAHIEAGNAVAVLARAHDLGAEFLLERQVAAGVVEVMVGVEDMGQPGTAFAEPGAHRLGLGGVHHRAQAPGRIAHQIGIIVAQAGDQFDRQLAHIALRSVPPASLEQRARKWEPVARGKLRKPRNLEQPHPDR